MGSVFRYISDEAMHESDLGNCQHCDRDGVVSYDYRGEIVDPKLASDVELAEEEPGVFAACAECILGGNLKKDDYETSRMRPLVDAFAAGNEQILIAYHKIPHIPLMMQDEDWPICCGDWCEYVGYPSDYDQSVKVPDNYIFWQRSPSSQKLGFPLKPESLREVCLFGCLHCSKSFFIWQPT